MIDERLPPQLARHLAVAKAAYDASGDRSVQLVGNQIRKLRLVQSEDENEEPPDASEVADARRSLWLQIPEFCRKSPEVLFARAKDRRLVDAALAWDWGSPCLAMCGPTYCAKTSVAAAIVIRLMARGRDGEFRKWKKIKWFCTSTITNAARAWPIGHGECPEVRAASRCDLLVLDDLGNEADWQSTIFDILQHRYQCELPLITTSGLGVEQLIAKYGDAIIRRLVQRDGKMGTVVDCWPSKR